MFNQGSSQLLSNNYNCQKFNGQLALDNQIQGIVSKLLANNILFNKSLKNKMNSGNPLFNVNNNLPPLHYQNQNKNLNFQQQQLDESNLIELLRNISLEPSNPNPNNISNIGQSLFETNNTGIGNSLNLQSQKAWAGGTNLQNNNNNLLLQKVLLLQLLNTNNQINNQLNNQLNNQTNNHINNETLKAYLYLMAQNFDNNKNNTIQNNQNQINNNSSEKNYPPKKNEG